MIAQEQYTTKVIVEDIVENAINNSIKKAAVWSVGVFGFAVFSGAVWVGTISADVHALKINQKAVEPKLNRVLETSLTNQTLLKTVIEENKQNRLEDLRYRETTSKNIQEFYRKNPNL